jgi:hypothetical protein
MQHNVTLCRSIYKSVMYPFKKVGSKTWVCALCSQDFTRKYSAYRHTENLHRGQGKIVRMLDYVIGRIAGEYHPGNPLIYRSKYKPHPSTFPHSNAKAHTFPFTTAAHNSSQNTYSNTSPQSDEKGTAQSSTTSGNESSSKLEEIRNLCGIFFTPRVTEALLRNLSQAGIENGGNEAVLDSYLQTMRNDINILEAFRKMLGASSMEENSPPPLRGHHHLERIAESSKRRLAKIEKNLLKTQQEAFVWEEIERLIKICESTNDHTFLDHELEFHSRNG